jgi:hypothetical protein
MILINDGTTRVRFSAWQGSSFLHSTDTTSGAQPTSSPMGTWGKISQGVKRSEREADQYLYEVQRTKMADIYFRTHHDFIA